MPAFEVYYDSKTLWPADSLERLDTVLRPQRPRSGRVAFAGLKVAVDQRLGELPLPPPELAPVRLELEIAVAIRTHHLPFGDEQSNCLLEAFDARRPRSCSRCLSVRGGAFNCQGRREPSSIPTATNRLGRTRARRNSRGRKESVQIMRAFLAHTDEPAFRPTPRHAVGARSGLPFVVR